jgi:cytochrome P450
LIDAILARDTCDGAVDYAQHIPVKVIAAMLGVPDRDGDDFRAWVSGIFEQGITDEAARQSSLDAMTDYFRAHVADRRHNPRDDIITSLLGGRYDDGRQFSENHVLGSLRVIMLGGIDTTWSAIGSALWHLATHADDRRRLVREPSLLPTAIEEFLRAYSPVTMAREIMADTTVGSCTYRKGETVLMTFPAANRDPDVFADPDKIVIDRRENRHIAFGIGIHRCIGSNLARMELSIAIETFLQRIPEFSLAGPVTWSTGTTRGPRILPLAIG